MRLPTRFAARRVHQRRSNIAPIYALLGVVATLAVALPGASAAGARPEGGHAATAAPTGKQIPCTCRFKGQDFAQGARVCIRGEMAECGMYLNNTSWKFTRTPCPLAHGAGANRVN